jgi:DMSO reductase iron-sulfur subunit
MSGAGFILDLGRCLGCGACVLACRLVNHRVDGISWRRILPFNIARYPGGPAYHFSLACNHCERPACLTACPAGAYEKRTDGIVLLHEERCLGCRYCAMACPFGAPVYDVDAGVMTKCHLCADRLDSGLQPACVAACPTEALRLKPAGEEIGEKLESGSANAHMIIPGFCDPAGCDPNIRFVLSRGQIRMRLLQGLQEVLKQ